VPVEVNEGNAKKAGFVHDLRFEFYLGTMSETLLLIVVLTVPCASFVVICMRAKRAQRSVNTSAPV
jgi:hypothetical protein